MAYTRTASFSTPARLAQASRQAFGQLLAAIEALAAEESPFAIPPPRAVARNALWLRPELVIRAEFAGWTGDGLVRQAAYKGIELEKDPRKVIREVAK